MSILKRILLFFVIPPLGYISLPREIFDEMSTVNFIISSVVILILFALLGYLLMRGITRALTLAIFLQGLNVIIRLMMMAPNSFNLATQTFNWSYILISLISIAFSFYLMLRIDRIDVRLMMVT